MKKKIIGTITDSLNLCLIESFNSKLGLDLTSNLRTTSGFKRGQVNKGIVLPFPGRVSQRSVCMYSTIAGGSSTVSTDGLRKIEIKESFVDTTLLTGDPLCVDTTLLTTYPLSLPNDNYSQFNPIFNFISSLSLLEFLGGLGVISLIFVGLILKTSLGDDIWDWMQYRIHTGFDWKRPRAQRDCPDELLRKMREQRAANCKVSVFSENQPENWRLTEAQCTELCIRYYIGGGEYYVHKIVKGGKDRLYTRAGRITPCSQDMIDHVERTPPFES